VAGSFEYGDEPSGSDSTELITFVWVSKLGFYSNGRCFFTEASGEYPNSNIKVVKLGWNEPHNEDPRKLHSSRKCYENDRINAYEVGGWLM
jgi:hypothetical protein